MGLLSAKPAWSGTTMGGDSSVVIILSTLQSSSPTRAESVGSSWSTTDAPELVFKGDGQGDVIQQEETRLVPPREGLDAKAERVPADEGFDDYDPAFPDQSTYNNAGSAVVSASRVDDGKGEDGSDDEREVSSQPPKWRRKFE
ncbi:uncharacterized protein LOC125555874 [Triticum urartu]|uniref:uncharacterized protein LOC125555874 n=1 Tax=Triticum urartu TaxID=4572 RepID=UPI002043D8B7|nr:uncharacterized protein LOC125555874 [Triticum urartu]